MSFKKLAGCFAVLLFILGACVVYLHRSQHKEPDVVEVEVEDVHKVEIPFKGRIILPQAMDFEVLENSACRDMEQMARFMQGRAAGLHWLANDHFRKAWRNYRKNRPVADVHVRLVLNVDSLGVFQVDSVAAFDSDDKGLLDSLQGHIKKYWRYRRSTSGKTQFVVPFTWTSKY